LGIGFGIGLDIPNPAVIRGEDRFSKSNPSQEMFFGVVGKTEAFGCLGNEIDKKSHHRGPPTASKIMGFDPRIVSLSLICMVKFHYNKWLVSVL